MHENPKKKFSYSSTPPEFNGELVYNKWRVKINCSKSIHITITLKLGHCPHFFINNTPIPTSDTVRYYIGLHFDK